MPYRFRERVLASSAHLPEGLAPESLDLLADGSLARRFVRHWTQRPAWPQLCDVDGRWLSSDELQERSREAALGLQAGGLSAGDRLVISAPTTAELVIAYVAALRAGLVAVPINPAYPRPEVQRIVTDAQPAGAVVDDDRMAGWIREAASRKIVVWGLSDGDRLGAAAGGKRSLARASDEGLDRAMSDDPALLIYTSGTTGAPKGALLSHGNLLASATAVNLAWRWEVDDRLLLALPLFHVHGLGVGVIGSLCAGTAVILRPRFDADDVALHARDSSLFFGVPAMYERLVSGGQIGQLARQRLLVSGSAPLPATLSARIADAAGQVPLERYGMTETVMLTSNPYDRERRAGTVGLPLPGVQVRLAAEGEVEVRGPNVIEGYYRRPEANLESFTADGWFATGDVGRWDADGYLTLVGRAKELIITGGYNVYPREVEEVVGSHPAVAEVAVVGRGSDRWGEEVTAVVVAGASVSQEQLREHAAAQLAAYKVPKRFEFVDRLPRNAMGKVVRGDL